MRHWGVAVLGLFFASFSGCSCNDESSTNPNTGGAPEGGAPVVGGNSNGGGPLGAGGVGGEGGSPPGPPPPIPPLVEDVIGAVETGPVTFEIPENTLGFTAVLRTASSANYVGVFQLVAPDGTILVDELTIDGTNFGFLHFGSEAVGVPMTDDEAALPPMPGTWTIIPVAADGVEMDLSIWRRQTLDGAFHGGLIDVNVFIVDDAVTESYAAAVVDDAFLDFAGLDLGTVSFHTLPAQFSVIDENNAALVLEATGGAVGKPAVNLIYTQVISFGALGFAASAPGLPLVHGTQLSGLVMTDNGQAKDALVLRHEMGHFAGLAHTSEIDPGIGDRLGDTPFCGNVDVQQLGCPDIDYLMFPYAIPNSPNIVSPLQTTVIQASPIYRGAVEPGGGFAEPLDQSEGAGADRAAPATSGRRVQSEPGDAWKSRHGKALVRFADAHWCDHHAANRAAPDHLGLLRTVANDGELWALATDSAAPGSVRARAMQAATRDGMTDSARATLAGWASTPSEPRALRAAALVALAKTGSLPDVSDDDALARLVERLH